MARFILTYRIEHLKELVLQDATHLTGVEAEDLVLEVYLGDDDRPGWIDVMHADGESDLAILPEHTEAADD